MNLITQSEFDFIGKEVTISDSRNKEIIEAFPKEFIVDAHHLLILHGRYVCKAQRPNCKNCIIYEYCEFKDKP